MSRTSCHLNCMGEDFDRNFCEMMPVKIAHRSCGLPLRSIKASEKLPFIAPSIIKSKINGTSKSEASRYDNLTFDCLALTFIRILQQSPKVCDDSNYMPRIYVWDATLVTDSSCCDSDDPGKVCISPKWGISRNVGARRTASFQLKNPRHPTIQRPQTTHPPRHPRHEFCVEDQQPQAGTKSDTHFWCTPHSTFYFSPSHTMTYCVAIKLKGNWGQSPNSPGTMPASGHAKLESDPKSPTAGPTTPQACPMKKF